MSLILTLLIAALLLWAIVSFNLLIRDRNRVAQSWSDVDVQLMRRHDLVPRLVELVKGYSDYEQALQTSLAQMRAQSTHAGSLAERGKVESGVEQGVHKLIALVEAYPDLKASANFLDLQNKLSETENQLQYARRYYNGTVNLLNNRIQRFPDLVIANSFNFKPAQFFQLEDDAKAQVPTVSLK